MVHARFKLCFLIIIFHAIFLSAACSEPIATTPETPKTNASPLVSRQQGQVPPAPSSTQMEGSTRLGITSTTSSPPEAINDAVPEDQASEKIDWGQETTLDEVVAMAKSGQIYEIQWHIMPNIIRALALDNKIFHIRNEDKGVDIRNVLEKSGILIGKGGITFRYLF